MATPKPAPELPRSAHATVRGSEYAPRSLSFEGRFGRMFRNLPPADFSEADLTALSGIMIPDAPAEPQESLTPAGYTYLGQFIAHDLTFDPASSLQRDDDPDGLIDYRTPRFDLDCLYGRGPDDQPYLYR